MTKEGLSLIRTPGQYTQFKEELADKRQFLVFVLARSFVEITFAPLPNIHDIKVAIKVAILHH